MHVLQIFINEPSPHVFMLLHVVSLFMILTGI